MTETYQGPGTAPESTFDNRSLARVGSLSLFERQVITAMAQTWSVARAARRLEVTKETVVVYLNSLCNRSGIPFDPTFPSPLLRWHDMIRHYKECRRQEREAEKVRARTRRGFLSPGMIAFLKRTEPVHINFGDVTSRDTDVRKDSSGDSGDNDRQESPGDFTDEVIEPITSTPITAAQVDHRAALMQKLSHDQLMMVRLRVLGRSSNEIAKTLQISVQTVSHRFNHPVTGIFALLRIPMIRVEHPLLVRDKMLGEICTRYHELLRQGVFAEAA